GYYPQDFINYVEEATLGVTSYDEFVASAGFGGELFSLPAGEVQFYLGAEFREASIDDTPDSASQTGDTDNFSTSAITRGSDSVWEVFGEVEVPLLRDLPIAKELTLSASGRYTDYESYGDDTTYKVGLLYQITDWVGLRATYGTSYRAPALFEQFLGATAGFLASTTDVCNNYDAPGRNPNLAANCASQGLPPGFTATSSVRQLNAGGAAAGLAAETSTNFTGGVVFTPTLPGRLGTLAVAVDYYDIQIDNGVSQVGSAFILNQCYTSSAADFAARSGYCAFVERAPVTNSLTVTNGYVNIATNVVEGIDYNLRYRNSFGPGDFLVNLNVTQYLERYNQLFPTDPTFTSVGRLGTPEFSASLNVQYSWDQWTVFWGTEWIDATTEEDDYFRRNGSSLKSFGIDSDLEEYYLHSASVRWGNDDLSLVMGVRNVFDVDPPTGTGYWVGGIGNSPTYSGYDHFGRTLFINVAKSF
ncbi:MAG: TonB-dependent receptor, partial [Brevundimonas sp.]|uniref:TonB-dependent receptor domain-containing protein n=1 Tax=Brevundimonas sp. TaxID=1871086 RepID=UPI002735AC4D